MPECTSMRAIQLVQLVVMSLRLQAVAPAVNPPLTGSCTDHPQRETPTTLCEVTLG